MRDVVMNDKTNLLQLEEHFYQLVDVDEPNTFRNLFPYEEIPKIAFNDRIVPHNMPEDIWITDTTFRDGQQSRAPYTTEQIVTIYGTLSLFKTEATTYHNSLKAQINAMTDADAISATKFKETELTGEYLTNYTAMMASAQTQLNTILAKIPTEAV